MLFPKRILLSLSALSPTLFPFLSLLSLPLVINSVVTFAEATPVPPKNLHPSGLQFEKCTSSQSSEFLFRVAFYDTQTGSTTKLGQGVLIICIGSNHCFGYSTTQTTTAGGPGSNSMSRTDTRSMVGTVIRTGPRKKPLAGLWSRAYHRLSITPDCDKFNSWSPPHDQEEHSPEITLVDFLTSIADLQNALREYAHTNSDATVTIDSDVSYILAILDYLHSKGMLTTYDKPQIGEFLETLKNTNQISGSSMLSWGFRNLQGGVRWAPLVDAQLHEKTTFLCFGVLHCFGLVGNERVVENVKPYNKVGITNPTYFFGMRSSSLHPSFDLRKFEEHLRTSTTPFFARLTGCSQPLVQFKDISSAEIHTQTGLQKQDTDDQESFYFRVLLEYMAAREIIGNYNTKTYGEIMKALERAKAGQTEATGARVGKKATGARVGNTKATAALEHGDDSSSSLPSGSGSTQQAPVRINHGGGAANHSNRITVSSLLGEYPP